MKKTGIILLVLALAFALAACGQQQPAPASTEQANNPLTTQGVFTQATQAPFATQTPAAVQTQGNTSSGSVNSASSSVFTFSVTGVTRYDLSDGSDAIIVDCSLTNKSTQSQAVSSLLCFSATDTSNSKLSPSLDAVTQVSMKGVALKTLDGEVAAGSTLSGVVYFSATKGAKLSSVTFTPVMSSEPITVQLGGI